MCELINKHHIGSKIYIEYTVFAFGKSLTEITSGTFIELNDKNFIFRNIHNTETTLSIGCIKSIYKPGDKIL